MKDDRGELDLTKQIDILQKKLNASEFFEKEMRTEIQFLKEKCSNLEAVENLLQGYKNVINDLSIKLRKAGK
jgi:hypothetical protein